MKPLFIPLKSEYFYDFATGFKTTEYRRYGPRWNERVCVPGRAVVLSLGYGKRERLAGAIRSFVAEYLICLDMPTKLNLMALYPGITGHTKVACVDIEVQRQPTLEARRLAEIEEQE